MLISSKANTRRLCISICSRLGLFLLFKMETTNYMMPRAGHRVYAGVRRLVWPRVYERELVSLLHIEYVQENYLGQIVPAHVLARITRGIRTVVEEPEHYTIENVNRKVRSVRRAYLLMAQLRGLSGVGWNDETETVIADPDVIEHVNAMRIDNARHIQQGCPYFDLCSEMWGAPPNFGDDVVQG